MPRHIEKVTAFITKGCSVLDQQSELASRIAVKQAMLGQTAIQPRLFQAGAALHGEN